MRSILDWDVKDLQAIQLRVDHTLQTTDIDYERDVPAGEDTVLQSRVQTTEEETGTHLRDRHPAEDAYLSDYVEDAESALWQVLLFSSGINIKNKTGITN